MLYHDPNLDIRKLRKFFIDMIWLTKRDISFRINRFTQRSMSKIYPFYSSILGLLFTALFLTGYIDIMLQERSLDAMIVSCATILGSFIALASTLAIIPIQNSMNSLTPTIRGYLNKDIKTQISFTLIACFTVALLILSVTSKEQIDDKFRYVISVFLLMCSFDLIRLYHRSILRLMEPGTAIARTVTEFSDYLKRCRKGINDVIQRQIDTQEGTKAESALIIKNSYEHQGVKQVIEKCISELAEVSMRSVASGDFATFEHSIDGIGVIYLNYLAARYDSLTLNATFDGFGLRERSDINDLIISILEHLKKINSEALSKRNENANRKVVRFHQLIGVSLVSTSIPNDDYERSIPDTFMVLAYLERCVLASMQQGMDDVVLEAARSIQIMTSKTKPIVKYEHFYGKAITCISHFCSGLYIQRKGSLANEVSKSLMVIAEHAVRTSHFQRDFILKEILKQYQVLLPQSIKQSDGFSSLDAYSIIGDNSILKIIQASLKLYADEIEKGEDREIGNRFDIETLKSVLMAIWEHFREIGPSVDFTDGTTHWNIVEMFKSTGELLFKLRDWQRVTEWDRNIIDDLIYHFSLLPAWMFGPGKPFTEKNAKDAADVLAWFGLQAMDKNIDKIVPSSIRNIKGIFEKFYSRYRNPYDRADILINLWILRSLAVKKNLTQTVAEIDLLLTKPVDGLTTEDLGSIHDALENRKGHLQRDLQEIGSMIRSNDARDILVTLLRGP